MCDGVLLVMGVSASSAKATRAHSTSCASPKKMIGIMNSAVDSCGIGRVVRVHRWLKSECARP